MISQEEHIKKHKVLHQALDELMGDYLTLNKGKRPSNTTLMELGEWSHQQTIKPTEAKEE